MTYTERISFWHSLRAQFLALFLGLSLIPLIVVSLVAYWQSQQALQMQTSGALASLAALHADMVDQSLTGWTHDLEVLAEDSEIQSLNPVQVEPLIRNASTRWTEFESLFVTDATGQMVATNAGALLNVGERAYFTQAMAGETYISDVLISKATGHPVFVLAVPIRLQGRIIGMVAGSISTETLFEQLASARLGATGEAYLINSAGYFITPSRFTEDLIAAGLVRERAELELNVDTPAARAGLAGETGFAEYPDYRGVAVLGAYAPVAQTGWAVIVEQDAAEAYGAVSQLANLMLILTVALAVVVVLLAVWISQRLTAPLVTMMGTLNNIAQGDLNRNQGAGAKEAVVRRRDEIGVLGRALATAERYLQELADTTGRVARGDLTVALTVRGERDELGLAFAAMLTSLRQIIGQVAQDAQALAQTSAELASAATQAGDATGQISTTMQQVAHGAGQQTESITRTAASVEQMKRAIDGVAKGAQEQAGAVATTSAVMGQLAGAVAGIREGAQAQAGQMTQAARAQSGLDTSLTTVLAATQTMAQAAADSAQAAGEGQRLAAQSVEGMGRVRTATGQLAARVKELGKRSGQIGAVVETIDDIAAQTNLLALNAAIEAARAGQHGKGFAVVADEVRKLAERSAAATKEIGEMIRLVQAGTTEVAEAMQSAGGDVSAAVQMSEAAQTAFETITAKTRGLVAQEQAIAAAMAQMRGASQELGGAVRAAAEVSARNQAAADEMSTLNERMVANLDNVSAVVEENTAATEQMAAGAAEVSQSIEGVASVSEENSAAVEEVSASAEQMSAQVQQITASAQTLDTMAQSLRQAVAQFQLDNAVAPAPAPQVSAAPPAPRRPAAPPPVPAARPAHPLNGSANGKLKAVNGAAALAQRQPANGAARPAAPAAPAKAAFQWDESFASGEAKVDEQHRELFRQLNALIDAMSAGRGRSEIEPILDFLERYVQEHFSYEEGCMERHRCPVAGVNQKAHARFVANFAALRERYAREGANAELVLQVRRDLGDWLVNHIRKIDTDLRACRAHS